ncbi:hypothetical protein BC831DRAFT_470912 [Entophlyctis helioformis]|nr:hypothetical protein BC831DRAFT_470912 [Entophlyctis helioformis]
MIHLSESSPPSTTNKPTSFPSPASNTLPLQNMATEPAMPPSATITSPAPAAAAEMPETPTTPTPLTMSRTASKKAADTLAMMLTSPIRPSDSLWSATSRRASRDHQQQPLQPFAKPESSVQDTSKPRAEAKKTSKPASGRAVPAPINTAPDTALSAKSGSVRGPVTHEDIERLIDSFWKMPSPMTPFRTPHKTIFSMPPLTSPSPLNCAMPKSGMSFM